MRNNAPLVELKHFSIASSDHAKAVIRVTHKGDGRNDKKLIVNSIRNKFGNRVEPVEGTFKALSSDTFSDTISGVVRVIRQTIPFVEGSTRGFTSFASNMFMDAEKGIWTLKHTPSGKLLVQTSAMDDEDSLNELLSSFSSAGSQFTPEYRGYVSVASTSVPAIGGDLVQFINRHSDAVVGYIVASVEDDTNTEKYMVLESGNESPEIIETTMVLQKLDASDAPKIIEPKTVANSILAATSKVTIDDMLAYYKKVFRRDPAYYEKFATNLRSHAFL